MAKTLADRPRAHTRPAAPRTIHYATLDTRSFSFEAFGSDRIEAWGALVQGLKRHGVAHDLPADWFGAFIGEIVTREVTLGAAYRDRELLKS